MFRRTGERSAPTDSDAHERRDASEPADETARRLRASPDDGDHDLDNAAQPAEGLRDILVLTGVVTAVCFALYWLD